MVDDLDVVSIRIEDEGRVVPGIFRRAGNTISLPPAAMAAMWKRSTVARSPAWNAKQYAGVTLNTAEEAGLLAMLGININGPEWEQLTGIKVQVNEIPFEELFTKQMLEHKAASGAYDVMLVGPSWVADFARAGAMEPLDPYIEKYGVKEEFDDIAPAFKDWMTYDGKTYGARRRWRRAPSLLPQGHFRRPGEHGGVQGQVRLRPRPAADLEGVRRSLPVHHRQIRARTTYGAGLINTGYMHFFFSERLRTYGGKFFDAGDDEGDGEQPGGGAGADRHGRRSSSASRRASRPGVLASRCRR